MEVVCYCFEQYAHCPNISLGQLRATSCHVVGKKKGNVNMRKYDMLENQSIYLTNFKGQIDSKTFIMVQERLKDNEQIRRSNAPSALKELAVLIKCKECGYAVKAYGINHKTGYVSLSCYGRANLKACGVSFKGVKLDDLCLLIQQINFPNQSEYLVSNTVTVFIPISFPGTSIKFLS